MTDSHTHLCCVPLSDSIENQLGNFVKNGGKKILNASFDVESSLAAQKLKRSYDKIFPNLIDIAVGIHPETFIFDGEKNLHKASFELASKQISSIEKILNDNLENITAIGESGLDYHTIFQPEKTSDIDSSEVIEIQKMSFRKHLELACKHNLPMTIHSRDLMNDDRCVKDTLKIICEVGNGKIRGSMHSYTGTAEYIEKILELGLYIGFNAIVTYKNAENVRELVRKTPLEKILLETDAPYLPLRIKDVKYGQSSDVLVIAEKIAEIKGVGIGEVLKVIDKNYEECFR